MKTKELRIEQLCLCAVMAAVYFILSHFLQIRIPPNIHITLASLPVILMAVLYGKRAACITALLGEFVCQALSQYGLTPTTPLWLLPPAIRGLCVALGCELIRRRYSTEPWRKTVAYGAVLVISAAVTTLANTGITWLDSVIFGYYTYAYIFGDFLIRLVIGIATALIMTLISIPILHALYPFTSKTGKAPEGKRP